MLGFSENFSLTSVTWVCSQGCVVLQAFIWMGKRAPSRDKLVEVKLKVWERSSHYLMLFSSSAPHPTPFVKITKLLSFCHLSPVRFWRTWNCRFYRSNMVKRWQFYPIRFYIYLWRVIVLFSSSFILIFFTLITCLSYLPLRMSLPRLLTMCMHPHVCVYNFWKIYAFRFRVSSLGTSINTAGQHSFFHWYPVFSGSPWLLYLTKFSQEKYQGALEYQGGEVKKLTTALDACWELLRGSPVPLVGGLF